MATPLRVGPNESVPALTTGDIVAGRYEIDGLAGDGGMAVVFSARHVHLNERFAVKVLRPAYAANPNIVSRFLQEARAAAQLRSDYVCRVFDVGIHQDMPYIVMELLEGEDLRDYLYRVQSASAEEAVEFIIQACEGLAEAHAAGLVHRDIKPENLFLTVRRDGWRTVKLLDFGISKLIDPETLNTTLRRHVDTKDLLGTPHYMAPECIRSSKDAGPMSDIWAMGVVLYELLSGKLPFPGTTVTEISASILETEPESLLAINPELPPELVELVHWCLAKQPELRVTSASELAVQLLPFAPRRSRAVVERVQSLAKAQGEVFDIPPSGFPPPMDAPTSVLNPVASTPASTPEPRSTASIIWWAVSAVLAFAIAGTITYLSVKRGDSKTAVPVSTAESAARPESPPEPQAPAALTQNQGGSPSPQEAPPAKAPEPPAPEPKPEPRAAKPSKPQAQPVAKPATPKPASTAWQSGPDLGF